MREEEVVVSPHLADSSWRTYLSVLSWDTWDPDMPQGTGKSLTWEMAKVYTSLISFSFQFRYYQYVIGACKCIHTQLNSFHCCSFLSPFLFFQPHPLLTLSHSPKAPGGSGDPLWIQTPPGWNFRHLFPKPWFHLVTVLLRSSEWHEYYSSLITSVHQLVFKAPSRGTGLHIQCELPPCSPYTHLFVPASVCILSLLLSKSHSFFWSSLHPTFFPNPSMKTLGL